MLVDLNSFGEAKKLPIRTDTMKYTMLIKGKRHHHHRLAQAYFILTC